VRQSGRDLQVSLRTRGRWQVAGLSGKPVLTADRPESHLCLELITKRRTLRGCFTANRRGRPRLIRATGGGEPTYRGVPARIQRADRRSIQARFRFGAIGLHPGNYRWRAISDWRGPACGDDEQPPEEPPAREARRLGRERGGCADRAPSHGTVAARIRHPRLVGCTRDGDSVNYAGSRSRKRIALTFDDGPSAYTGRILKILDRAGARGTFFELGSEMSGRASTMRAVLRQGSEIGNHTVHHLTHPSGADLAHTNRQVRRATGFTPCVYRPPYGLLHADTTAAARRLGMSTIIWDVDTLDWMTPGSGAIYGRAVSGARAGSIILMHDGGGFRGQTVDALSGIVSNLKHRGFELVTVSKLLGERTIWKP
jgi:peptidoglycan/xylan/chitin deacetylase (PgdA/CDA1 family)